MTDREALEKIRQIGVDGWNPSLGSLVEISQNMASVLDQIETVLADIGLPAYTAEEDEE